MDVSSAMSCVSGYVLALDMTARELQEKAKEKRLPWTVSKGFDTFCALSGPIETNQIKDVENLHIWLKVGHLDDGMDSGMETIVMTRRKW